MNTLQSTAEPKLNRLIVPQENPELEALWTSVFADEYKPAREIDYEKIKNIFIDPNIHELCDYMLSIDSSKRNSISVLESLSKKQKDTLVELLLRIPIEKLHEKQGVAMIFWLRNYSSPYHDKHREMFQEFWIKSEGKDRYNLLEKARNAQPYYDKYIGLTLKQYILFRNLYTTPLNTPSRNQYLGADFSFAPLVTKNEHEKGWTRDWDGRAFDRQGKEIPEDVFRNISSYKENNSGMRYLQVVNHSNPDIHKDFSGTQYRLYLDGPVGIGLMYKEKPVAVISFGLKAMDTIYIHQMQKVSAHQFDRFGRNIGTSIDPVLHNMDWQNELYTRLMDFVKSCNLGIQKVEIKSAINNEWIDEKRSEYDYSDYLQKRINVKTEKFHLSKDIASKIYDVFAKKNGFKKDKETKDWKRKL